MFINAIGIWYRSENFPAGYLHKVFPYGEHAEYFDKKNALDYAQSYIKTTPLIDGSTCLVECQIVF